MTQAALQLVPASKSRAKKETKSDIILRLESEKTVLQDQLAQETATLKAAALQSQEKASATIATISAQLDKLQNPEHSEVVETIKVAFQSRNMVWTGFGLVFGGWAPLASYIIAHIELQGHYQNYKSAMLVGALLFSAPTVFQWFKEVFDSAVKAFGLVVLLEGVMCFSDTVWLGISALVLLMVINGIQSGCNMALRREKNEFKF